MITLPVILPKQYNHENTNQANDTENKNSSIQKNEKRPPPNGAVNIYLKDSDLFNNDDICGKLTVPSFRNIYDRTKFAKKLFRKKNDNDKFEVSVGAF